MDSPSISDVIRAAADACKSLSQCGNFFNFDKTNSWRGWENWLTVDVIRRLDSPSVVRFGNYPDSSEKTDILISGPNCTAVEIKVNYVDSSEVEAWKESASYKLPRRVTEDLWKLNRLGKDMNRVFLFAIAFENTNDKTKYKGLLDQSLAKSWGSWASQWHECETFMLLALSS